MKCWQSFLYCNDLISIVPPIIKAVKQEYVSTRGSNVTLVCNISNPGRPVANFGWRRRGSWLPNNLISTNSTRFSLTLSNVTEDDAGSYSCAAKGVLSFRIQKISLQIKGSYISMSVCMYVVIYRNKIQPKLC